MRKFQISNSVGPTEKLKSNTYIFNNKMQFICKKAHLKICGLINENAIAKKPCSIFLSTANHLKTKEQNEVISI